MTSKSTACPDAGDGSSDSNHSGIQVQSGADAQVRHCRIHDTRGTGLAVYGGQITLQNLALLRHSP
jgi:hypothetical protein